jgi:hypothetical protein
MFEWSDCGLWVQEMDLALGLQYATGEQAEALWSTLAGLSKLNKVSISVHELDGSADQRWAFFFQSISQVSQVR